MNNSRPDVIEILSENIQNKPFPAQPDFRISISDRAYKAIIKHAKEDQKIEICGILIGEVFKDSNGPYLEISDIIRGEHADNQAGQVMFTHETWEYINSVKDGQFSDKLIVGWYHTHPRFGIFLSDQDVFIHKNFFDKPWQVAFVFDPIQEEEGFFIWRNGIPEKTKHYWLEGKEVVDSTDIKKIEKLLAERVSTVEEKKTDGRKKPPLSYLVFGFTIVLLLFLTTLYFFRNDIKMFLSNPKPDILSMSEQSKINESKKIVNIFEPLIQKLTENKRLQGLHMLINFNPSENKAYFEGEVFTFEQKEILRKQIASMLDPKYFDIQNVLVTHIYIIQPGESLSEISEKIYGNPNRVKDLYLYQAYQMMAFDTTKPLSYIKLYLPELK